MSSALVKLVAVLLVIVQGALALTPGSVLCIPVRICGGHGDASEPGCERCGPGCGGACTHELGCHGHKHGPLHNEALSSDECGCHVHVPVPSNDRAPAQPVGERLDLRLLCWTPEAALATRVERDHPARETRPAHPPDFGLTAQVRALKAARLNI